MKTNLLSDEMAAQELVRLISQSQQVLDLVAFSRNREKNELVLDGERTVELFHPDFDPYLKMHQIGPRLD